MKHYYEPNDAYFKMQFQKLVKAHGGKWVVIAGGSLIGVSPPTDVMSPDGRKEKRLLHFPNFGDAFSYAQEDVKANWELYRERYFRKETK